MRHGIAPLTSCYTPAMRKFTLAALLILSCHVVADDTPKSMTKMVVQMDGPDIPQDSFTRKPKTIYRAGTRFCRVEEQPDNANGIQGLMVINEPDTWMVNLLNKTAKHVVDAGPTFNCHLPIFRGPIPNTADDLDYGKLGLEFGHELELLNSHGEEPQQGPVQQTKKTTAYKLQFGGTSLALFTYGDEQIPLLVGHTYGNKGELVWYSGYGQIPFDPNLFEKPDGVTIEEPKN